jgi:hypothetical protein
LNINSYHKNKIRIFDEYGKQLSKGWFNSNLLTNYRATFPIIAIKSIKKGDELVLRKYSNDKTYLQRMKKISTELNKIN